MNFSRYFSHLVRCPCLFRKWKYNRFNFWRNLTRPSHWRIMRISGWEFLTICRKLDKFCDHRHCESGDVFSICHVTLTDHTFKGLCVTLCVEVFHNMSTPGQIDGYWSCATGYIHCVICHITLPNNVIEGSCNFICENSSLYVNTSLYG